jgi:hypothetical protein
VNIIYIVQPFINAHLNRCIDSIQLHASAAGYSVNIMDPEFNTGSIDNDPRRLNVRTDKNGVITSFTVG